MRHFLALFLLCLSTLSFAAEQVNINTADATTIASNLKGIGDTKAKAIVDYRKANGAFKSADDLVLVKGIGEKTVSANRSLIKISQAEK